MCTLKNIYCIWHIYDKQYTKFKLQIRIRFTLDLIIAKIHGIFTWLLLALKNKMQVPSPCDLFWAILFRVDFVESILTWGVVTMSSDWTRPTPFGVIFKVIMGTKWVLIFYFQIHPSQSIPFNFYLFLVYNICIYRGKFNLVLWLWPYPKLVLPNENFKFSPIRIRNARIEFNFHQFSHISVKITYHYRT